MRAVTLGLVFAAALGQVAASEQHAKLGAAVFRRQAFDPHEETGHGETCVDAFGPGYVECRPKSATKNPLCINPSQGHTCCQNLCECPNLLSSGE